MLGTLRCRRILPKFDYWDNCSTRGLDEADATELT